MYKIATVIILGLTLIACSNNEGETIVNAEATGDITTETIETSSSTGAEQTLDDQLPMPPTLEGAIEAYTPNVMEFHNEFPTILGAYALWNEQIGFSWNEINLIEKTSYGKIMKDPITEYGKRLCVNGNIIEIETDRSLGEPIYNLGMTDNELNVYRATAVKSSGDLVEGSTTTLCGVVIGKLGYDNAGGGTTRAPYLFGMFDLPENK